MTVVSIDQSGDVKFVHDDEIFQAIGVGGVIERASHVEPEGDQWTVDLTPVNGPVVRGFSKRSVALAWEKKWIEENVI